MLIYLWGTSRDRHTKSTPCSQCITNFLPPSLDPRSGITTPNNTTQYTLHPSPQTLGPAGAQCFRLRGILAGLRNGLSMLSGCGGGSRLVPSCSPCSCVERFLLRGTYASSSSKIWSRGSSACRYGLTMDRQAITVGTAAGRGGRGDASAAVSRSRVNEWWSRENYSG